MVMDLNIPNEVMAMEDVVNAINWVALLGIITGTLLALGRKICFVAMCFYGCAVLSIGGMIFETDTIYVFMVLIAAMIPQVLPWSLFCFGSIHIAIGLFHYLFENYIWP